MKFEKGVTGKVLGAMIAAASPLSAERADARGVTLEEQDRDHVQRLAKQQIKSERRERDQEQWQHLPDRRQEAFDLIARYKDVGEKIRTYRIRILTSIEDDPSRARELLKLPIAGLSERESSDAQASAEQVRLIWKDILQRRDFFKDRLSAFQRFPTIQVHGSLVHLVSLMEEFLALADKSLHITDRAVLAHELDLMDSIKTKTKGRPRIFRRKV